MKSNPVLGFLLRTLLVATLILPAFASAAIEPWYTYWSLGVSNNDYPGAIEQDFAAIDAKPGITRSELAMDLFGFYWPTKGPHNNLLGFVVNATGDSLTDGFTTLSLNTYLYAASYMGFLGNEPGDGFFYRGDLGLAKSLVSVRNGFVSADFVSSTGTGFVLGIGWGIPVSQRSRVMLGLDYTNKTIDSQTFSATMFTIGGLW